MQSRLLEAEIATFITQIETRGIDDIQINVTDLPGGARDRRVREAGDARPWHRANKLLAKSGSELDKLDSLAFLQILCLPKFKREHSPMSNCASV